MLYPVLAPAQAIGSTNKGSVVQGSVKLLGNKPRSSISINYKRTTAEQLYQLPALLRATFRETKSKAKVRLFLM